MNTYDFSFSISDAAAVCGIDIPPTNRSEKKMTCPFCGGDAFYINEKRNLYNCFKCGTGGGTLDLVKRVLNLPTNKEAKKYVEESLYGKTDTYNKKDYEERKKRMQEKKKTLAAKIEPQSERRCDEELSNTYAALLRTLVLAPDHREALLRRGLPDLCINLNGYKTVPELNTRRAIAATLIEQGLYLDGVPGFGKVASMGENKSWCLCTKKRGILIPIKNMYAQTVGMQIRIDDNLLELKQKKNDKGEVIEEKLENKYVWLSSKDITEGCGSGAPIHYAIYNPIAGSGYNVEANGKKVFLTEGPLKADIAHALTGLPFISVPGVNCQNALAGEIRKLKEHGVTEVINCYDMDAESNIHVKAALEKVTKMINDLGLKTKRALWPSELKGIDDYLKAKYPKGYGA